MTNIISIKRAGRLRKKLKKVTKDRFRLTVFKSAKNISAQIVDDKNNKTLISASSVKKGEKNKKISEKSQSVAEILAKKALENKITKVYFDRGRYKYHGRIKAFADALRKGGLVF
jgi:large subunit ribosomal protein L18